MARFSARRRGADATAPTISVVSYSQSSDLGGVGVVLADTTNMQDGLAEPFAVTTNNSLPEWIQVTLAGSQFVSSVTLVAPTTWGAGYINGRTLQRTNDASPGPGSSWTDVQVLAGFTTASSQDIIVGAQCTALRLITTLKSYLAIGDFRVS